jgi:hypothetical protein
MAESYPPDRPLGAEDRGVTDAEDSVDERRRREIPEAAGGGRVADVGSLVDDGGPDDEADAVAGESRRTEDAYERSVQDLEEVEPAEEAAMHLTDEPPMGDGDGYIDEP